MLTIASSSAGLFYPTSWCCKIKIVQLGLFHQFASSYTLHGQLSVLFYRCLMDINRIFGAGDILESEEGELLSLAALLFNLASTTLSAVVVRLLLFSSSVYCSWLLPEFLICTIPNWMSIMQISQFPILKGNRLEFGEDLLQIDEYKQANISTL